MKHRNVDLVHIRFRLTPDEDGWPDMEWERLWAEPVPEGFRVRNIPFYVQDIGLHDVVAASPSEVVGDYFFEGVVQHSGHRTIRIVVRERDDVDAICSELAGLGCSFELGIGGRFVAVDIPPSVDAREVLGFIAADEAGARRFGVEEAHVDWYGPEWFGKQTGGDEAVARGRAHGQTSIDPAPQ